MQNGSLRKSTGTSAQNISFLLAIDLPKAKEQMQAPVQAQLLTITTTGSFFQISRIPRHLNYAATSKKGRVTDDRNPMGQPFPRVSIFDGPATVIFGTENFSAANLLEQQNFSIFDAYKFYAGKHILTIGTDNEINRSNNVFIRDYFGTYTYSALSDFYNNLRSRTYTHTFSLLDDNQGESSTKAAARFKTLRLAFFLNDEIKASDNFTLNLGLRADNTEFLTKPLTDNFLNDTGLAKVAQYYDLQGARSGQIAKVPWSISPRIGFTLRLDDQNMVIRGGLGLFSGRIPLVWPGGVYITWWYQSSIN